MPLWVAVLQEIDQPQALTQMTGCFGQPALILSAWSRVEQIAAGNPSWLRWADVFAETQVTSGATLLLELSALRSCQVLLHCQHWVVPAGFKSLDRVLSEAS